MVYSVSSRIAVALFFHFGFSQQWQTDRNLRSVDHDAEEGSPEGADYRAANLYSVGRCGSGP
jgi:hypothetical protein